MLRLKLFVLLCVAALAPAARAACDWNAPGSARYTGRLTDAVDAYRDIPAPARTELKARIEAHQFDDLVEIRRDSIDSRSWSYSGLRDMHWARGMCRGEVNRRAWTPTASEGAAVYCVGDDCLIVPAVCGNVARVTRTPRPLPPEQATLLPSTLPQEPALTPAAELALPDEPTGAGVPPTSFAGLVRPTAVPAAVIGPTPTPVVAGSLAPFSPPPWMSPVYLTSPALAFLPAAVPEPPVSTMIALGALLLLGLRCMGTARHRHLSPP